MNVDLARCAVFFDFDNTMTAFDVLDEIIRRFSVTEAWRSLQRAWETGQLGSKACMEEQLRDVRVTPATLLRYLDTIRLDPSFKPLLALVSARGAVPVIVSDNFAPIIEHVLRRHEVAGVPLYANQLRWDGAHLIPSFPYHDPRCPRGCANCKRQHLLSDHVVGRHLLYIGDGHSDICPAERADLVFAKATLLRHLQQVGRPCLAFTHLGEVHTYLMRNAR